MKNLIVLFLGIFLTSITQHPADAQNLNAQKEFKKYIHSMVQDVEQADSADEKREILNRSLNKLQNALVKVENMDGIPEADRDGIANFKDEIREKQMELNGEGRFNRVSNSELNKFAEYIQQDLEQADRTLNISLTAALLIVIILLLL